MNLSNLLSKRKKKKALHQLKQEGSTVQVNFWHYAKKMKRIKRETILNWQLSLTIPPQKNLSMTIKAIIVMINSFLFLWLLRQNHYAPTGVVNCACQRFRDTCISFFDEWDTCISMTRTTKQFYHQTRLGCVYYWLFIFIIIFFLYYSAYILLLFNLFLILLVFMGPIVLFQLPFIFIYNIFSKKFSVSAK